MKMQNGLTQVVQDAIEKWNTDAPMGWTDDVYLNVRNTLAVVDQIIND